MSLEKFKKDCIKSAGKYSKLLEKPPKEIGADFALPCFSLGNDPVKISSDLAQKFKPIGSIKEIKSEGPYVNFYADWEKIGNKIIISARKKNYGKGNQKKKFMVEFAHPNTHKLFHIGHLRNITTGESVARILEYNGMKIIRTNYQGDIGLHIAKCLWGIKNLKNNKEKIKFLGEAYAFGSKNYEKTARAKKEIIEINKKIYEQEKEIIKLWAKTRKWSLDYFDKIYKRVYTNYDRFYFESEVFENGLKLAKKCLEKNILKKSQNAVIFDGEKFGLDKRVFINSLGFPTYEAKELGLAELEFSEFGKIDKCIHVVGPEQKSFFKVTFKVQELLNTKYKDKQFHLIYGWVRLKKGKMSSRLGKVIEGNWLIDELKKNIFRMIKNQNYSEKEKQEISEDAAVGAAKYYFLKFNTSSEISFDMREAISLEGDSGPYIQYTYTRTASLLRKSKKKPSKKLSLTKKEIELIKKISQFPQIVEKSAKDLKPNYVANYLSGLSAMFNNYYHENKIIGSKNEKTKLAIVSSVKNVLSIGLNLLGIKTLEKM